MSTRERWTLIAAVLGSSIVFVDSSVVTVALPKIGRELPTTVLGVLEGQLYVYTGYLLTLSALLILAGALSDYYGRRRIFLIGLVGFGLTSVLCGLAPNMEFLVVSRVLQGAAGAILVPGSLALITANFFGEAQGRAYGVWAAATAATRLVTSSRPITPTSKLASRTWSPILRSTWCSSQFLVPSRSAPRSPRWARTRRWRWRPRKSSSWPASS